MNIYIIYSNWSIDTLTTFLNNIQEGQVGMMKIVYDSACNETNKTIAVLSTSLYDTLISQGYGMSRFEIDFKIKRYKFNDNILPPKDKSRNLFIPIMKQTTEMAVTSRIHQKLEILANFDIIPQHSWRIKCPINSRENGLVKLGCFIFFKSDVTDQQIGIVRFLLNHTYWDNDKNNTKYDNTIKCYWAKPRTD